MIITQSTIQASESLKYKKDCFNKFFYSSGENNSPPYAPVPDIPIPAPIDVDICWYGGDPDPEDNVTYYLYFGLNSNPPLIAIVGPYPANYTYICYDLEGLLEFATKYYLKIVAFDNNGASNSSGIWCITTENNSPPYAPVPDIPDPAPIDVDICWYGGDPNPEDNVTYHLYFGEYDPFGEPPLIAIVGPYPANYTYICYDLEGLLEFNTKYYLKIVAFDNYGANSSSGIWNITIEENKPPNPAFNPIPPDGAKCVPTNAIIRWNGSDPNSGDTLTYDIYFGPNPNPPLAPDGEGLTNNWYDPYGSAEMPMYEDFYWRIVTRDLMGVETSGPNWTFMTGVPCGPPTPEIDGPTQGKLEITYYYNFTIDDNHCYDSLILLIDWDDGTDWKGPIESNSTISIGHCWEKKGIYVIKAKTMDLYGLQSDSGILEVTIPRNRITIYSFLHWFFNRLIMLERQLNLL